MRTFLRAVILIWAVCLTACMGYGKWQEEEFTLPSDGVFIVSEGNFMYGNATLSFYNPETKEVENDLFARANSMKLGDVAMGMAIVGERGYIAVDNSGVVFVIDTSTGKLLGLMRNLISPRQITTLTPHKAYITSINSSKIIVFNPTTLQITGQIETHHTTEQIAVVGNRAIVTCWSYDNTLLSIDTSTDEVVDSLKVAIQPRWITTDAEGKVWVLTDGGYQGSQYGYERAALYRIEPQTLTIESEFRFGVDDSPRGLATSPNKRQIYFINRSVWQMGIEDTQLPTIPFIDWSARAGYDFNYALGIAPNGEAYLANAIDYMQSGVVYRYSTNGEEIDNFRVGIIPSQFCFK